MLDDDKIRLMKTIYSVLVDKFKNVPKSTMIILSKYSEEETLNAILRDAMSAKDINEFYNNLKNYKDK